MIVSSFADDELVKDSIRAVNRGTGAVSPKVAAKVFDRPRETEPDDAATPPRLSDTQREILRLIAEGHNIREIVAHECLSENTVTSHVEEIFRKLDVRDRVEAGLPPTKEGRV